MLAENSKRNQKQTKTVDKFTYADKVLDYLNYLAKMRMI